LGFRHKYASAFSGNFRHEATAALIVFLQKGRHLRCAWQ